MVLMTGGGDFRDDMVAWIDRRADHFMEQLQAFRDADDRRPAWRLPATLEEHVTALLDRYHPPGARTRGGLVFESVYAAVPRVPDRLDGESCRNLVRAQMAAELESRGPVRLTQAQTVSLAHRLERIGAGFLAERLPALAAVAFDLAGLAYLQAQDDDGRDRSLLARARARQRARAPGWKKTFEWLSGALTGYGYRPYRLLAWMGIQVAVFFGVLTVMSPRTVVTNAERTLLSYLNAPGIDDIAQLGDPVLMVLIVESYTGALTTSVFFALLVRRWFRI